MKIQLRQEPTRTEEREVQLTVGRNAARLTYEGGLRLSTGMDSLYVLPEHLEDFREVMVAVLMELER